MNNYTKLYYWILLNLKITFSYFLIALISVIIGLLFNLDIHLVEGELSVLDSIQVFLTYILYPIPIGVLLMFIVDKLIKNKKINKKKLWFVIGNVIWNILLISSFGNWDTLDGYDKKGFSHLYLFLILMSFLIIVSNIVWVLFDRFSFFCSDREVTVARRRLHTNFIVFFIVYYASIAISLLFFIYAYGIEGCFDGLIFDEMLMSFNGIVTFILLGYGLFLFFIKKLRFKFLIIILVPIIYISYNFLVLSPGYNRDSKFHKFRNLLIHYNPIWLKEEERGHTKFNP